MQWTLPTTLVLVSNNSISECNERMLSVASLVGHIFATMMMVVIELFHLPQCLFAIQAKCLRFYCYLHLTDVDLKFQPIIRWYREDAKTYELTILIVLTLYPRSTCPCAGCLPDEFSAKHSLHPQLNLESFGSCTSALNFIRFCLGLVIYCFKVRI